MSGIKQKKIHGNSLLWAFFMVLPLLGLPNLASAWWEDSWSYRVPIKMDGSKIHSGSDIGAGFGAGSVESSELINVPVLLRLHAGNFEDFFLLKEDLSDLRFIAGDDKTPLKHHVEHFDLLNQMLFVWVQAPKVTPGVSTDKIWMYYGNTSAVPNEDVAGSYAVDQSLVFHFSANDALSNDTVPNNTVPNNTLPTDKTAYENPILNSMATINPASIIASGARFDGKGGIAIQDTPALVVLPEHGATYSMWVKPSGLQNDRYLLYKGLGANSLTLGMDGTMVYGRLQNGGSVFETPRTANLTLDTWQHLALVLKQGGMSIFINGSLQATIPVQLSEISGLSFVGSDSKHERGFVGEMDEVRFSKTARSPEWVQLAALNQGPQDLFLVPLPGEKLGGSSAGGTGFFEVIFTSTEASGWTVIMLLGLMAIISWFVMIGKGLYIRHALRDNQNFLEAYKALGNQDPMTLDKDDSDEEKSLEKMPIAQALFGKHDHFQSSPIYHMFHKGMNEVKYRKGKSVGAQAVGLSPHAIDAIRAALDADLMREVQKLNSQMVLLTIAVSGGPFLGLLGTVIGVMITFAAIAATGDVDIAAIAPGVAAALLTTVAGLIVAIPALFGYNYLSSKIKDAVVEMRVFSDEYITKIAEMYGE